MDFKELTPEQMEKAKACKSSEDLIELAKSEGVELSDEQFEAISGGHSAWDEITGDSCDSYDPGERSCNDYH